MHNCVAGDDFNETAEDESAASLGPAGPENLREDHEDFIEKPEMHDESQAMENTPKINYCTRTPG